MDVALAAGHTAVAGLLEAHLAKKAKAALGISTPRPDLDGLAEGIVQRIVQLERSGWAKMKWDGGYTLLHWAAKKGRADFCSYFLEFKAALHETDAKGLTPLDYAKEQGQSDALAVLDQAAARAAPTSRSAFLRRPERVARLAAAPSSRWRNLDLDLD